MNTVSNAFLAGKIPSNGAMVQRVGVFGRATRKVGWERQRELPEHLRQQRDLQEQREEIKAAIAPYRSKKVHTAGAIACRKVAGNKIQILGHGKTVDDFGAAKEYACGIGRSMAVMGAIRAKV